MSQAGIELFARSTSIFTPNVWIAKTVGVNSGAAWEKNLGTGLFSLLGPISPLPGWGRFPWLFEVEPDV